MTKLDSKAAEAMDRFAANARLASLLLIAVIGILYFSGFYKTLGLNTLGLGMFGFMALCNLALSVYVKKRKERMEQQ